MTLYQFDITFLNDKGQLQSSITTKHFDNKDAALIYFQKLCDAYDAGPYYYLCSWGEALSLCTECNHKFSGCTPCCI